MYYWWRLATLADFEFAALSGLPLQEGKHDPPKKNLLHAATTGRFALYPYIREYVYDLTGRLAPPPLTLEICPADAGFLPAPNGQQREERPTKRG